MTRFVSATVLLTILLALPPSVHAQEEALSDTAGLKKAGRSVEDNFGILDKGELINVCGNQGLISDSYQRSQMYCFRWPKSKGLATNTGDVNAINRQGLMFGYKGNVSDSYNNRFNEDWQGVAGGLGKYYADDQPADLKAPDGTPRMAHSDIPKTWPSGYFDSLKVWHASPVGAFGALSTADQSVVTRRAAWYDGDKNIWRFWPGRFRIDMDSTSATYRQQLPGEFAADREVYCVFRDRNTQPPDKPIGIQVAMQAYSWGRRFGQDIQFYDFIITNTSSGDLDSCAWGYLLDFRFGDANEEGYTTFNSGINPAGFDNCLVNWDWNGATDPIRGINSGYFGSAILATPRNMGVTDGHFFRMNTTYQPKKVTRNVWPVMVSNPNDPAFTKAGNPSASNYFHGGANTHFDVFDSTYWVPSRWDFTQFAAIMSTSLFSMKAGESVRACIAYTAASTLDQLKRNVAIAQKLFLAEYNGPSVPPSPKLTGVAGDRRNTLYWSDTPEKVIDVMSRKIDFEGYKIYRSQDKGATWGKGVVDGQGRLIGYVPVAQFDKVDDIQGVDPLNSFNYLGSNSGLRHMWVDSTVANGVEYSYTITSYDTGDPAAVLESNESSKGTTSSDINLVDLSPRTDPAGALPPQSSIRKSPTVGKALMKLLIADPGMVTGDQYKITFNKTIADTFLVFNKNDMLMTKSRLASDEMNVVDGFRLRIETDAQIGGIKRITDEVGKVVSSSTNKNASNLWFVTLKANVAGADTVSRASDYEFRFTPSGSFVDTVAANGAAMVAKVTVPFEVWNVTNADASQQVTAVLEDANRNGSLDLGEGIRIVNLPYKSPTTVGGDLGVYTAAKASYIITIDTLASDASKGAKLPVIGQSFKIETYSAVTRKDTFYVCLTKPQFVMSGKNVDSLLGRIRVVPNPYIGAAKWEQVVNTRRMQFTFLPAECTISIYTVRGELVQTLQHNNKTGAEDWNLTNQFGVEVAFGLYVYIVETPDGNKVNGKFAIIK
jgi:hypothetical protein